MLKRFLSSEREREGEVEPGETLLALFLTLPLVSGPLDCLVAVFAPREQTEGGSLR